jgi:hypothetical protein
MDEAKNVVARREFVMRPKGARCLCLWYCACFCFGTFLTTEANDLCHVMKPEEEIFAGFYDETFEDENVGMTNEDEMELESHFFMIVPIAVISIALFLGKFALKQSEEIKTNLLIPSDVARRQFREISICFKKL